MTAGERKDAAAWMGRMAAACAMHAVGSVCLLVGAMVLILNVDSLLSALVAGTILGALSYGTGWLVLGLAIITMREETTVRRSRFSRMLVFTFAVASAGFVLGILALPWSFPEFDRSFLGWGYFLYIPSVYALAAVASAAISILSARRFADRETSSPINLGGSIIGIVVLIAVADQALYHVRVGQLGITLAGLSLGYGILTWGWLRGYRRRRSLTTTAISAGT